MTEETPGDEVLCERRGAVALVTLNRPHVRNAMNTALRIRFQQVASEIREDGDARVLVITGAGPKAFSTGGDLKERDHLSEHEFIAQRRMSCSKTLLHYPKPVVAAINGDALGGGFELAMVCDIRVAAEHARFGFPEIKRGIFPGSGGTSLLARLIGMPRAKDLILTGRLISAQEALQMGLLSRVVPAEDLLEAAMSVAGDIAANAPIALEQAKMVIEEGLGMSIDAALKLENEAWTRCLYSEDRKEGIRAFNEKRPPRFTGR